MNNNTFSISLKGLRYDNEDKHKYVLNGTNEDVNLANIDFFGLYDGHGGKYISNFLYNHLHVFFTNKNVVYPIKKSYIKKVFQKLQQYLIDEKFEYANHCGSTCLIVMKYVHNDNIYVNIANTGDSRCIMCRNNIAISLTKDHKPNWPEELKRITELGGIVKFDGFDWRINDLSVSRAFGDLDTMPYVTNEPDIYKYQLTNDDKFIVIACDGLWDVLDNQEVANFILLNYFDEYKNKIFINKLNSENNNIAKKLAKYALDKGSSDNITIIIIFL
jgi:serine/threonine protein phosphatase PrpC